MQSEPNSRPVIAGRYELLQELGRGGMGVVHKALDRVLEETVAVKVLLREASADRDAAERFKSEIKLARRVSHPNVCRIHDYGDDDGLLYISMEFVEGRDLKKLMASGRGLSLDEAFDAALQVAAGLEAIHAVGIVHRDLKTPNLMRDSSGRIRIMDFGIARSTAANRGTLTATGMTVGTPDYMSPEQALGRAVDARSDLYAFAVVLFELFTGQLPFHGDTPMATLLKHINEPPPLDGPVARRLPAGLVPVLRRALAKSVAERFASAAEMGQAIRLAREAPEPSDATTRAIPNDSSHGDPAAGTGRASGTSSAAGRPEGELRGSGRRAPRRAGSVRRAAPVVLAAGLLAVSLTGALWWSRGASTRKGPAPETTFPRPAKTPAVAAPSPIVPSAPVRSQAATAVTTRHPPPSPRQSVGAVGEPEPSAVEPEPAAIPIGTRLFVSIEAELRSDRVRAGAEFSGSLANELTWEGRVVAAAGTPLRGRVIGVSAPGATPFLELALSEIALDGTFVPLRTGAFRLTAPGGAPGDVDVKAVVVETLAGAGLGAVARGKEGALAGGAAGAAIGAAAGERGPRRTTFVFSERLPFRLAEPLAVPTRLTRGRSS